MRTSTLTRKRTPAKSDNPNSNEKRCPAHAANFPDETSLRPIGDFSAKGTYCRRCLSIRNKAKNAAARVGADNGDPVARKRSAGIKRKPALRGVAYDGVLPLGEDPVIDTPIMLTQMIEVSVSNASEKMLRPSGELLAFKQYWIDDKASGPKYCVMATGYGERGDYRTDFYRVPFGSFRSVSPDELDAMGYTEEAELMRRNGEPISSTQEDIVAEEPEFAAEGEQVANEPEETEVEVADDSAEESEEEADEEEGEGTD